MLRRMLLAVVLAGVTLLASGCIYVSTGFGGGRLRRVTVKKSKRWFETNRIAIIDVDGFIASGKMWSWLGGTSVADVKEKLQRAADDGRVVAVVLRINSPGGEASASDTIYQEIRVFKKETGKPVVAVLIGTAASGAYYVACSADRIVAQPTCITGSVGVIMRFYNLEGLYYRIGLREEVIKSGELKDIGSSSRQPTPKELALLQNLIHALYEKFLAAVQEGRPGMNREEFEKIADGRPLTAEEALKYGLVDRIGYVDDAIEEARSMADVGGADVILYSHSRSYNANVYAGNAPTGGLFEKALDTLIRRRGPMFLYLWDPGR